MTIRKHIPNTVTCLNLVCGVLGILFVYKGRLDCGLYFMLGGAFFDFCDGLVARALNVSSEIGKQLDSLSDATTFGLLPALMLHRCMVLSRGADWWCLIPLLITVFSVLRLAKFNVDERQGTDFLGLATPASALLCASLVNFIHLTPGSFLSSWAAGPVFVPALSVILCVLMVSEIPMFSFKLRKGMAAAPDFPAKIVYLVLVLACLVVTLALRLKFSIAITLAILLYILVNLCLLLKKARRAE